MPKSHQRCYTGHGHIKEQNNKTVYTLLSPANRKKLFFALQGIRFALTLFVKFGGTSALQTEKKYFFALQGIRFALTLHQKWLSATLQTIMLKRIKRNWYVPKGQEPTDFDKRILSYQNRGELVPTRKLIKTPEQIEGIKRSCEVNTGVLDLVEKEIHAGMSTEDIDKLVYDYTVAHGAIPAPLNYEGFPKSVCTSINEVVCHGIPSEFEVLEEGDIINVDVSTILDGYYSDASRMFIIGKTSPEKEKLVRVTKECLEIGAEAAKPWGFVGDIGKAIEKHAKKNGFSVVRDLCGHGVGLEFHEDPEVDHYNTHHHGMLLVPGMVFTVEPMINMGDWHVFIDEEDGWTVVTEDELPSAQWEHTFLMTEHGLEVLTY